MSEGEERAVGVGPRHMLTEMTWLCFPLSPLINMGLAHLYDCFLKGKIDPQFFVGGRNGGVAAQRLALNWKV